MVLDGYMKKGVVDGQVIRVVQMCSWRKGKAPQWGWESSDLAGFWAGSSTVAAASELKAQHPGISPLAGK